MAAITAPDDEMVLLAEEEQAQQDANALRQALDKADCKRNKLVTKRHDAQAAWEKHEVDQHEVDVKVRGRLLVNAAVAQVQ